MVPQLLRHIEGEPDSSCHNRSSNVCSFLVIVSLSLVSDKSAFLHDGYIVTIENCYAPMVVKCILFATHIVSVLLGTSFKMIFDTHVMSVLSAPHST